MASAGGAPEKRGTDCSVPVCKLFMLCRRPWTEWCVPRFFNKLLVWKSNQARQVGCNINGPESISLLYSLAFRRIARLTNGRVDCEQGILAMLLLYVEPGVHNRQHQQSQES